MVLTIATMTKASTAALDNLWPPVANHIDRFIKSGVDRKTALRCLIFRASRAYIVRLGEANSWKHEEVRELTSVLEALLSARESGSAETPQHLDNFRNRMNDLQPLPDPPPFAFCKDICTHKSLCMYRRPIEDATRSQAVMAQWAQAFTAFTHDPNYERLWTASRDTMGILVDPGPDVRSADRSALCYTQMMVFQTAQHSDFVKRKIIDELLKLPKPHG